MAAFKKQLEEKKNHIIKQLESIGHRKEGAEINFDADFPEYGDSMEDSAMEVADYTKNLSFERKLEKELGDVEKALAKIADKSYGQCNYCHQSIEIERLKIRPESTACVACKKNLKGEA